MKSIPNISLKIMLDYKFRTFSNVSFWRKLLPLGKKFYIMVLGINLLLEFSVMWLRWVFVHEIQFMMYFATLSELRVSVVNNMLTWCCVGEECLYLFHREQCGYLCEVQWEITGQSQVQSKWKIRRKSNDVIRKWQNTSSQNSCQCCKKGKSCLNPFTYGAMGCK